MEKQGYPEEKTSEGNENNQQNPANRMSVRRTNTVRRANNQPDFFEPNPRENLTNVAPLVLPQREITNKI